jgi:PAS domain S-box-containing protein
VGEDAVRFSNPLLPLTRSELALPLISRGQVLGALNVQSKNEAAFSSEDIETFQIMADQLANAILNARLYNQLELELEERKQAEEIVRLLNSELETRVRVRTIDLQASEEKFRALTENNPLQITRFDRDGRYLYVNRVDSYPQLQPKDISGKKLRDVLAKDARLVEFAEDCIHQVFETGKPLSTEYAQNDYYALWSLAPEFGPNGEVISVITSMMDITERKMIEEELHARSLELQAANRELEAFSYSVSHDLRAPLRAIDGFSRILMDDYKEQLSSDAGLYLQRISEAAQHMGQLIDDILRLSRITRTELHTNQVDLSWLAESIMAELVNREPERQIQIEIQSGLIANGDERLLRVALENLLSNAMKFTGKTENAAIRVGAVRKGTEKVFYISDNGVGFDMAYSDKLFGAFQRLHNNEEFPGTGIGLAIVQRVINRHGGKIWSYAEKGKGATFYFTL